MKTQLALLSVLFPILLFAQSPMSMESLPDLANARAAYAQLITAPNKYVVIGGHITDFLLTKNAEIFNTTTKTWQTASTVDNRDMPFVAKLNNGKYLIGAGCSSALGVGQLATTEIYDPSDNSFTAAASMSVARTNACAATLKDGRVLVVGNWYNTADNAEVYDPATNTFTTTGACIVARALPVIIPTNDGGAIVCGGIGIYGSTHTDFVFEKYDPVSNTFSALTRTLFNGETSWNIGCYQPTLTQQYQLPNGKYAVLVYNADNTLARLISIDPATSTIEEIKTQKPIPLVDEADPSVTYGSARTLMIDQTRNLIHIVQQAGAVGNITLRIVTINLTTGSVNTSKMTGFDYHVTTSNLSMLPDGRILFTGGNKPDNFILSAKAFIITPATYIEQGSGVTPMIMDSLPKLANARAAHVQLVPGSNKYVVIGGHINDFLLTKNAEIFNGITRTWQSTSSADNRDMPFVAKLNNGKYLIGAGCSSTLGVGQLATTEIYDPMNDSFTAAASMSVARTNACAATLKDGRVLVVGNWYNTADNAEVYDPATNTFTLTGTCIVARAVSVIIPTNDGGAIVFGGIGIYGATHTDFVFEKYNPITNSFTALTRTLFNGETSWNISTGQPTLTEQYLMPNGKYAVLVYNADYTLARLISIDPATSAIEEIKTQKPIPLADDVDAGLTFGCARTLMIDPIRNLIHIIQQGGPTSNITLRIVTINLLTGSVNTSKMSGFDYAVSSSNLTMLPDGRILFTGGNKFDNFTLSDKAFIITPARYTETGINNPQQVKTISARWDNSAQVFLFNEEIASATLYNITGKALYKTEKCTQLSTPSLSTGVYIIKVKRLNAESQGLKVIKQ